MSRPRTLLLLLALLASGGHLLAQAPTPSPTPTPPPVPEDSPSAPFRPSEDVPADAEVDFPGDI